jgi:hypothetical protein
MDALQEAAKLVPENSVVDCGIAHHMRTWHEKPNLVVCVGEIAELRKWREEIAKELDARTNLARECRWWYGTDVGASSATIMGVLGQHWDALELGKGQTPRDADDFGRCERLLGVMPEWRDKLGLVADHYPAWKPIVERWAELEAADVNGRNAILEECGKE